MKPRIEISTEKKFIGMKLTMSFANYKIGELWKSFMPRRKEIINNLNNNLISMVVYKQNHFTNFNPTNEFERWATVEVSNFDNVPSEMLTLTLAGGLYAVFTHKGSSNDHSTTQYIFGTWLPNSGYLLDNRPHFEILGEKYKNNDLTSEEEIWIPITSAVIN